MITDISGIRIRNQRYHGKICTFFKIHIVTHLDAARSRKKMNILQIGKIAPGSNQPAYTSSCCFLHHIKANKKKLKKKTS